MIPRHITKTYGRAGQKDPFSNKTFDNVFGAPDESDESDEKTVTASTMVDSSSFHTHGRNIFTAVLATEPESRKRKAPSPLPDPVPGGLFGDPFSFDSDDEGPNKPKKGMGFKSSSDKHGTKNSKGIKQKITTTIKIIQSSVGNGQNGTHAEVVKSSNSATATGPGRPAKVYGRPIVKTVSSGTVVKSAASSGNTTSKKQLSMDLFTNKLPSASSISEALSGTDLKSLKPGSTLSLKTSSGSMLKLVAASPVKVSTSSSLSITNSETVKSSTSTLKTYGTRTKMYGSSTKSSNSVLSEKKSEAFERGKTVRLSHGGSINNYVFKPIAKASEKTIVKSVKNNKFFTSRNNSKTLDHNYSQKTITPDTKDLSASSDDHNYSSPCKQRLLLEARRDSPNSQGGGKDSPWEEYDSDWDIESGDPEIIFNSPKKKAEEMSKSKKKDVWKCSDSNSPQVTRMINFSFDDCDRHSNATVSSEDVEMNSQKESSIIGLDEEDDEEDEEEEEDDTPSSFIARGKSIKTYGKCLSVASSSQGSKDSLDMPPSGLKKFASFGGFGQGKLPSLQQSDKMAKKKDEVSRRLLTSPKKGAAKFKAKYNARSWTKDEEGNGSGSDSVSGDVAPSGVKEEPIVRHKKVARVSNMFGFDDEGEVTTMKISRPHKPLFTVVRNVKQAHECQEHGETQEFTDDIEYIMDGLRSSQPPAIRCLSVISLASKCTSTAFRMHLRAHDTLNKIFALLKDANKHPTLAMCTAALMYVLSRDHINMDLEPSTLDLMIRLMSVDSQLTCVTDKDAATRREHEKKRHKIQELTQQLQREGGFKQNKKVVLQEEEVETGHMAMDTLLSLTSRKAGDWFKEELRKLGGLDHIINAVVECGEALDEIVIEPSEAMLDNFSRIDRCLRVLENVTYMNPENQQHLIVSKNSILVSTLARVLRVCENCQPFNEVIEDDDHKVDKDCPGYMILSCLLSCLRVLLNLTHDCEFGSTKVGQQANIVKTILACVLRGPQYVPVIERFDLCVLGLGLLVNLMETSENNRRILLETKTCKPFGCVSILTSNSMESLEAISMLFNQHCSAARMMEEEHDAQLEEREKRQDELRDNHPISSSSSIPALPSRAIEEANKSGVWRESEEGLEWVVLKGNDDPDAEEDDEDRGSKSDDEEDEGMCLGMPTSATTLARQPGGGSKETPALYMSDSDDDDNNVEMVGSSQDDNENLTKALHKYGKHMEDSIVAAYVALLIGCVIQGNSRLADRVLDCLPNQNFDDMIRMLRKFLGFMNFTSAVGTGGSKSIARVIEILESHNCE